MIAFREAVLVDLTLNLDPCVLLNYTIRPCPLVGALQRSLAA